MSLCCKGIVEASGEAWGAIRCRNCCCSITSGSSTFRFAFPSGVGSDLVPAKGDVDLSDWGGEGPESTESRSCGAVSDGVDGGTLERRVETV